MEIKPCPFCHKEISEKDCTEKWYGWVVTCPECDSSGSNRLTKEQAIIIWNQLQDGSIGGEIKTNGN